MPRLVITISPKMDRVLKAESAKSNSPVAAIVRQAVVEWAERRGIDARDEVVWGGFRAKEDDQGQSAGISVV